MAQAYARPANQENMLTAEVTTFAHLALLRTALLVPVTFAQHAMKLFTHLTTQLTLAMQSRRLLES